MSRCRCEQERMNMSASGGQMSVVESRKVVLEKGHSLIHLSDTGTQDMMDTIGDCLGVHTHANQKTMRLDATRGEQRQSLE